MPVRSASRFVHGLQVAACGWSGPYVGGARAADGAALSWHAAPGGGDRKPRRTSFSRPAAPLPLTAVLEVRPATREDASKPGYMGTEVLRHNVDVRSAAR